MTSYLLQLPIKLALAVKNVKASLQIGVYFFNRSTIYAYNVIAYIYINIFNCVKRFRDVKSGICFFSCFGVHLKGCFQTLWWRVRSQAGTFLGSVFITAAAVHWLDASDASVVCVSSCFSALPFEADDCRFEAHECRNFLLSPSTTGYLIFQVKLRLGKERVPGQGSPSTVPTSDTMYHLRFMLWDHLTLLFIGLLLPWHIFH